MVNLHRLGNDAGVLQRYLSVPWYIDVQYARKFTADKDLFHQCFYQACRFPAAVFRHRSHGNSHRRYLIIRSLHSRRYGSRIENVTAQIIAIIDTGNNEVRPVIAEEIFHSHFDTVYRRTGNGYFPYPVRRTRMFMAIQRAVDGHRMGSGAALPCRSHDGDLPGIAHHFFFQDLQALCLQSVIIGK